MGWGLRRRCLSPGLPAWCSAVGGNEGTRLSPEKKFSCLDKSNVSSTGEGLKGLLKGAVTRLSDWRASSGKPKVRLGVGGVDD